VCVPTCAGRNPTPDRACYVSPDDGERG